MGLKCPMRMRVDLDTFRREILDDMCRGLTKHLWQNTGRLLSAQLGISTRSVKKPFASQCFQDLSSQNLDHYVL
jgi:hypothetical protein